jgi:preprotein translocase subunit YajC
MDEKIAREIKFLKIYSLVLTLVLLVLFYLIIKPNRKSHFQEIL